MKKIILGCAAVLLSLGLLAGCNNKEDEPPITEAVSLSVSQTSVNLEPGGSASVTYTVDPAGATVMALSDHEEYVTAVAQEGTIYLEAVAAGTAIVSVGAEYEDYASAEAQITVTVAEVVEPGLPEIVLSVDPISTALIEGGDLVQVTYSVDPEDAEIEMKVANEEYATVEYLDPAVDDLEGLIETAGWYLTPVAEGETTLTVTASLDEYETASVEVAIKVHAAGWEPVETQTNYTLTVTFASAIPDYADAYICGYLNGGSYSTGATFVEYEINGAGKMTISENRLSVSYEFATIPVGEIIYNIYFEFNSYASSHEAATDETWEHHVFDSNNNSTFVVSDDSEVHGTEVILEVVPTDIINDDVPAIELTIALKNTNTNNPQSGFPDSLIPSFYHWVTDDDEGSTFVEMTRGACGDYTAETDYYFTVSADGTTEDGAGHTYSIDQGAEFGFSLVCQKDGNDLWGEDIILSEDVQWSAELPISMGSGNNANQIKIDSGFLNASTNLLVLELDFSAYISGAAWGTFNPIITGGSYYANWY